MTAHELNPEVTPPLPPDPAIGAETAAETLESADPMAGWHRAEPPTLPRQTYVPAVLAAGLVLLFWGLITTPILAGAGLGLLGFGVGGWIEELEFERRRA